MHLTFYRNPSKEQNLDLEIPFLFITNIISATKFILIHYIPTTTKKTNNSKYILLQSCIPLKNYSFIFKQNNLRINFSILTSDCNNETHNIYNLKANCGYDFIDFKTELSYANWW